MNLYVELNPFKADWSAHGHTMCLGHWQISFKGKTLMLPESVRTKDMGTFGNFSYLFDDDPAWEEGLKEDEWILDNIDWLSQWFIENDIPVEESLFRWFYQAVNQVDWRCSSCGGCI